MPPAAKAKAATGNAAAPAAAQNRKESPVEEEVEAYDYDVPVIIKVKPEDQLDLTPEELEEEVPPRVLYPTNPRAPHNITTFSYKEQIFKRDDQVDQMIVHLSIDGGIFLKDAQEQVDQDELLKRKRLEQEKRDAAEQVDITIDPPQFEGEEAKNNTLRNQFNFCERSSQTFNELLRERGIATEPPPTTSYCDTVTQWIIYDLYIKDGEKAKLASEHQKKDLKDIDFAQKKKRPPDPLYSNSMRMSIKLMERLVNQNAENDIYHDFKYWEDKSDEYRDGDGTLLPLWRFASEKAKRKQVTSLKWNPQYQDLFAVGFGSYDFMRQAGGAICCYSLKNTRFPEYVFNTDSGVCSLDWHQKRPALLAVGLYDGTVLVYDVRSRNRKPMYTSTVRTKKHTDPVWEVRWNDFEQGGIYSFNSISSDGRIATWLLMKDKLESEELMALKLLGGRPDGDDDDETTLTGLAGGLCFDFHPTKDHLFLVGTEEGRIHKCSVSFSGQYLETYVGHAMAVYTVRWNHFHPKMFMSASADWTVKLWDFTQKAALMSFDLGQAVGDVAWAPYSSTAFAAVTSDGVAHIYDLNINRNERICCQKVVKRAKLTHVAFNGSFPVILIGDDRGGVNSMKLSPNLRLPGEPSAEEPDMSNADIQIGKMNHLLEMVTETVE